MIKPGLGHLAKTLMQKSCLKCSNSPYVLYIVFYLKVETDNP